ncbi:hypothetical protein [Acidiluteibacter ferrifornacis]|uniref:Lipoprotein n=1 Tax=Acidiluteibacter ferrifornacis TaxID=2692424 RepID=A0A6N9NFJ6_9FLAO|nr:hypothetical protein [Acidiluteibacter ferrifornacis]NBG65418.1 hypothetical protein [Acidiluteibacter ferrifornacis]
MRQILILLLTIGLFSCVKNKETDSNTQPEPEIETSSEISDFDLLKDFESNKTKFNSDTLEILDHSTDGGELIVYHDNEFNYVVMDFWLYGETGKLNYTYWTDNDFQFKFVKKVNYEYDKPYYEEGFKVDSVTMYLTYSEPNNRLFDSEKKEITDKELVDSTKNELNEFYKDVTQEIKIIK